MVGITYPPFGSSNLANPSALVGPAAVNGSAATAMRSDAAPALDQTAAFAFSNLGNTAITTYLQSPVWKPASNSTTGQKITKADGTTSIVTIDSTNSNVGINTTPAAYKLHVKGTNDNSILVDNDGSQFTTFNFANNGTVKVSYFWDNTNTALFFQTVDTAFPITFRTGTGSSNDKLKLTSTGVTILGGMATPAGGSTSIKLVFGSTSGFGIYIGSGAPTIAAAQGSLYLRSDGSGVNNRAYINTDGSTTWTAIVTVG